MGELRPQSDDELLADLFDRLLADLAEGHPVTTEELLPDRPDLRDEVENVLEMAEQVAVTRPGRRPEIHGYEILREIGRGGMGVVYLAREAGLGRTVALKVLPRSLGMSRTARRRFVVEARAMARVQSDHIVAIYNIIETGDVLAYAMEYIDGLTLSQVVERMWKMSGTPGVRELEQVLGAEPGTIQAGSLLQFFVDLFVKIARAVERVHENDLIHRDIKPSNVLLRRDGSALLSDFGLAREASQQLTEAGSFVGTVVYASPEQLRGDSDIDRRADVYSLGATLYEVATGQTPFLGRTASELLRAIEHGDAVPLSKRSPDLPRDLATIVHKAIATEPARRYQTMAELAEDLERLLQLRPILACPAGIVERASKFLRRHRRTVLAASLASVVVGGLFYADSVLAARHAKVTAQADEAVRRARVGLLLYETKDLVEDEAGLLASLDRYEEALRLRPGNREVRLESRIVSLVRWLGKVPERELLGGVLGWGLRDLPVRTRELASQLIRDRDEVPLELAAITDMGLEDRSGLGLLAFLTDHPRICELAWEGLAGTSFELARAGLAIVHQQDGRSARAYPELLAAVETFRDATLLHVHLADAALMLGDVPLAETWLAKARGSRELASTVARLDADLAWARGQIEDARAAYRGLLDDPVERWNARLRLAQLAWAGGDPESAVDRVRALIARFPDRAEYRRMLAAAALELRRVPLYLEQVRHVLVENFGKGRSQGTILAYLEILRAGGLRRLYEEGRRDTGCEPSPSRRQLMQSFWPGTAPLESVEEVEALLVRWARFERDLRKGFIVPSGVDDLAPLAHGLAGVADLPMHWPELFSCFGVRSQQAAWVASLGIRVAWRGVVTRALSAFSDMRPSGSRDRRPFWRRVTARVAPPPLADHTLVPTGDGLVLFGGDGSIGQLHDETWKWDGQRWTLLHPKRHPSARMRHAAAYDVRRKRLVLFGGSTAVSHGFFGDTWEFDGSMWHRASPARSPSPRNDHAMTYDSDSGRVLLFGGRDRGGDCDDLWAWDGNTWTPLPASVRPPPRHEHDLVFDEARGRVVLFGGQEHASTLGDVWEWNGVSWSRRGDLHGPDRMATDLVYDPRTRALICFGGFAGTEQRSTWTWDGNRWRELAARHQPTGRSGHAMAWDATRGRLVLFGGFDSGFCNDTWEF